MAQVTFKLPGGSRVRSSSQRALVLISEWTDPDTDRVHARVEKRSDDRGKLLAERNRLVGRGMRASWFIGRHADRSLEVLI